MLRVEVKKSLVSDNGKSFNEGMDVAFDYHGCSVICTIKKIHRKKGLIEAVDVNINGHDVVDRTFYLNGIEKIDYVYTD